MPMIAPAVPAAAPAIRSIAVSTTGSAGSSAAHHDQHERLGGEPAQRGERRAAEGRRKHDGEHEPALGMAALDCPRNDRAADRPGDHHPDQQPAGGRFGDAPRFEQRLQPGRERDEDPEPDEHQPAQQPHRQEPPERTRRVALDRDVLRIGVTTREQREREREPAHDGDRRLHDKQSLDVTVAAERRPEQQSQQHADEPGARAERRSPSAARRQRHVLARKLRSPR